MAHPSTSFHDGDTLLSFRLPDLSSCWSLLPEYTLRTHPLPLSHPWGLALRLSPPRNLWWPSHHGLGTFSGLPQGPMRPSHPSQHIWHQAGSIGTALRDLKAVCFLHTRLGKKGTPKMCVECNVFLTIHNLLLPSAPSSFLLSLPETPQGPEPLQLLLLPMADRP